MPLLTVAPPPPQKKDKNVYFLMVPVITIDYRCSDETTNFELRGKLWSNG